MRDDPNLVGLDGLDPEAERDPASFFFERVDIYIYIYT